MMFGSLGRRADEDDSSPTAGEPVTVRKSRKTMRGAFNESQR
jgi:hypothetical protein